MDDFISGPRTFFAIALTTQENLKNICLLIPLTETKELCTVYLPPNPWLSQTPHEPLYLYGIIF